jgi:ribosome maturation factor RimP
MDIKKKILAEVETIVENAGLMLIDLDIRGNDNNRIIEVFIDADDFVTTELCSKISREIGDKFEVEEIITSKYRLDVSSPGTDRSLKYLRQFKKNINRMFEIKVEENGQNKKFTGELTEINNEILSFKVNKEIISINFSNIKSAKILIRF